MKRNVKIKKKRCKVASLWKPIGVIAGIICLFQITKQVNRKKDRWFIVNQMSDL